MRSLLSIAGVCVLAAITASGAHATLINFDDASAPKLASSAPALTTKYSALGVTFSAEPGPYAGTPAVKILNQKSGFGVNARSGSNFLTYDQLTTGGAIMTFSQDVTDFSIWAAGRDYPDIKASFFDEGGSLLSNVNVAFAGPSYSEVSYNSPFRKVVISGNSSFVMDDLSYTITTVPEPASWTTMIVGLGLCGAMRRRWRRRSSRRGRWDFGIEVDFS